MEQYNKKEIWRPVIGYEGYYEVSNIGRVRSVDRIVKQGTFYVRRKGKMISLCTKNKGYIAVGLTKNGKQKEHKVHRLVAMAFICNPYNLPQVNHKDENTSNNNVENLEWCDNSYNINYGKRNERLSEKVGTKVYQYTLKGELVSVYPSFRVAGKKLNIPCNSIMEAASLKGNRKTAGGYVWLTENDLEKLEERIKICSDSVNKQHKTIIQKDRDGNVVGKYNSLTEAHLATKLAKSTLMRYIHNINNCPFGSFEYL